MKLWNKWSFMQNKTHYLIIHHAFTIQYITLLSKYIKWISRGIFLKSFTHVNTSLCYNGSLVSRVWTASNYSKDYWIFKFSRKVLPIYRFIAVIIGSCFCVLLTFPIDTQPSFSNNSYILISLKLTGITVTKMAAASPLHQTGDGERYLKQNCPVGSSKSKIISLLLHLSKVQTWVFTTLCSVMLSPDATCQFEHRPLQEQLQGCTKCDS